MATIRTQISAFMVQHNLSPAELAFLLSGTRSTLSAYMNRRINKGYIPERFKIVRDHHRETGLLVSYNDLPDEKQSVDIGALENRTRRRSAPQQRELGFSSPKGSITPMTINASFINTLCTRELTSETISSIKAVLPELTLEQFFSLRSGEAQFVDLQGGAIGLGIKNTKEK